MIFKFVLSAVIFAATFFSLWASSTNDLKIAMQTLVLILSADSIHKCLKEFCTTRSLQINSDSDGKSD